MVNGMIRMGVTMKLGSKYEDQVVDKTKTKKTGFSIF